MRLTFKKIILGKVFSKKALLLAFLAPLSLLASEDFLNTCKTTHKVGYAKFYQELKAKTKSGEIKNHLSWFPSLDIQLSHKTLNQIESELSKHYLKLDNAIMYSAGYTNSSRLERRFHSSYPNISTHRILLALKSVRSHTEQIESLDQILQYGDNLGFRDAHRHIAWSAMLTRKLGAPMAMCILALHETSGAMARNSESKLSISSDLFDTATLMDLYNNSIGIQLGLSFKGEDEDLFQEVEKIVLSGKALVLDKEQNLLNSDVAIEQAKNIFKILSENSGTINNSYYKLKL